MKIRKAIFAINSEKTRAFLIEEIPLENAPAPDSFPWWNGVRLVVCTTSEDVVDWFIDDNPYIRIIEEEPNDYRLVRVEHSPHPERERGITITQGAILGGSIAGAKYDDGCNLTKPIVNASIH